MFKITKKFECCSGHFLEGLPSTHPCSMVHGHNYVITVELSSKTLNDVGFVVDYRKLDPIKQWIDGNMDHQFLNSVFLFNPTAENIAKHIYDTFKPRYPELIAVEVSETPKTNARYAPEQ